MEIDMKKIHRTCENCYLATKTTFINRSFCYGCSLTRVLTHMPHHDNQPCRIAITDKNIATAQREECNKGRSGMSLCGIEDCRKCPKSSIFDSEKYGTIAFDAAVGETEKSESKFCGTCEHHAQVDYLPRIFYGRKRDNFKFCLKKNRSVNASDSACGAYSPKDKSFPKEEPAKTTKKQALNKLRQKNRARFARKNLSDSEVYQNATPEERAGMDKLANYLLAREQSSTKRQPCSADKLRRSSVYKCALPEEREAMLIRHYELELARISHLLDDAVDKANHAASCDLDHTLALSEVIEEKKKEINRLKYANTNLALEVKRLNTRLCVRKKIADKHKVTAKKKLKRANDEVVALNGCNRKLEEEVQRANDEITALKWRNRKLEKGVKLTEKLADAAEKLEGKWRLLDKGEPYMRGDLRQLITNLPVDDWEWDFLDELAGDKHDGDDIVIRRITFE